MSILELARSINRICNNPAGIIMKEHQQLGNDPKRRQPDITKAKNVLDWEPKVSLEEGIIRVLPYFEKEMKLA
jgi:dTDP-glucose 4,6-dehydratase